MLLIRMAVVPTRTPWTLSLCEGTQCTGLMTLEIKNINIPRCAQDWLQKGHISIKKKADSIVLSLITEAVSVVNKQGALFNNPEFHQCFVEDVLRYSLRKTVILTHVKSRATHTPGDCLQVVRKHPRDGGSGVGGKLSAAKCHRQAQGTDALPTSACAPLQPPQRRGATDWSCHRVKAVATQKIQTTAACALRTTSQLQWFNWPNSR